MKMLQVHQETMRVRLIAAFGKTGYWNVSCHIDSGRHLFLVGCCFILCKLPPSMSQAALAISSDASCINMWATRPREGHSNVQKISWSIRSQSSWRTVNLFILFHAYLAGKSHVVFVKHIMSCFIPSCIKARSAHRQWFTHDILSGCPYQVGVWHWCQPWISTPRPWVGGVAHQIRQTVVWFLWRHHLSEWKVPVSLVLVTSQKVKQ